MARSARLVARSPPTACSTRRATLYLIGDAKASKLLRPIFLALLSEIVDRAYERATLAGGRLELPLLLCLDEAGNVAPLPNLAEIASTAPSHNIQLVSIFHDLAQARSRYGRQAETVVNSHRARMLLPGVADLDTLRYFAELVGEEEARELTRTTGAGGTSRSERTPPAAAAGARGAAPVARRATRCCSTGGWRRRGCGCGCGSRTAGCARTGGRRHELVEPDDERWDDATATTSDDGSTRSTSRRWPLDWRGLYPRERWLWFEQLWTDVCTLRERYRLALRSGWWEDESRSRRSPRWRRGRTATTAASGTTRPASSRCSTTSSGSPRCCATARSRSIPTATGSRSPGT